MSLVFLLLSIGWPGAATHRDATLRIGWGDFVAFVAWSDLVARLLTILSLVLFVRFAGRVHRDRVLERERKVVPFAKTGGSSSSPRSPSRLRNRRRLRHTAETAGGDEPVFELGELRVDLARRQVFRSGAEVHLTPNEYKPAVPDPFPACRPAAATG